MAHKAESFKLTTKKTKAGEKKVIVLYTNVEPSTAEEKLINTYLLLGYEPMFDEKKDGKSVNDMREELKADKEALKKFEEIYKDKNGFFDACKYYNEWKNVSSMRKELKADDKALKEFEEIYKDKNKGYSEACKYYNNWKNIPSMREELKADEEALKEFEEIYKDKNKGYSEACEYYNEWKNKKQTNNN